MRKKNILVVMNTMICGGIEKSGLAFLAALPVDRFNVTLLLVEKIGELLDQIPAGITVRELSLHPDDRRERLIGRRAAMRESLRKGKLLRVARSLLRRAYCFARVPEPMWRCVEFNAMLNRVPVDETEYDCAIAYADELICVAIVGERINARLRLAWFHTEYPDEDIRQEHYQHYYQKFDHLYAVSEALAAKFNARMPNLLCPLESFPHVIDPAAYAAKAHSSLGFDDNFQGLRLLSVGRLAEQKGFDLAIAVHARLIQKGYAIRWYVVGGGHAEASLRETITSAGLQDSFVLLGQHTNPYAFFLQCDIYVQPSRYEGYCLTVAEARAFAKPIVCTDFAGAREQLVNGQTGLIVPCDIDALYQAVKRLLDNPELRQALSKNLAETLVDTTDASQRLIDVIDSSDQRPRDTAEPHG